MCAAIIFFIFWVSGHTTAISQFLLCCMCLVKPSTNCNASVQRSSFYTPSTLSLNYLATNKNTGWLAGPDERQKRTFGREVILNFNQALMFWFAKNDYYTFLYRRRDENSTHRAQLMTFCVTRCGAAAVSRWLKNCFSFFFALKNNYTTFNKNLTPSYITIMIKTNYSLRHVYHNTLSRQTKMVVVNQLHMCEMTQTHFLFSVVVQYININLLCIIIIIIIILLKITMKIIIIMIIKRPSFLAR